MCILLAKSAVKHICSTHRGGSAGGGVAQAYTLPQLNEEGLLALQLH